MLLKSGDVAPGFVVEDIDGNTIDLDNYKSKKLLICFFRYAGCPFCNVLLHSLIERYPNLQKNGLEIIAFVQSPRAGIMEYPMKRLNPKPTFPIIADPERKVYDKYKVFVSAKGFAKGAVKAPLMLRSMLKLRLPQGKIDGDLLLMPAFFLVGPNDLKIHQAYYGADFTDSIPDVDILNFTLFD